MSEINENAVNETTQENNAGSTVEIEVKEGGKVKKVIKWVIGGLVIVVTAIGGILLGKGLGDKDDSEDQAETEGPKDE